MATPSEKHEIHCAKRYLEYTETPFYRAFRDRENPESFDSNYAVLKRMEEAEQSLAPLRGLCALRTLDLGCRGAKDKVKLDFNMLYPQLDSLTITPSLKEYFITNTEAGR